MDDIVTFSTLGITLLAMGYERWRGGRLYRLDIIPGIKSKLSHKIVSSARLIQINTLGKLGIRGNISTLIITNTSVNYDVESLGFEGNKIEMSSDTLRNYTKSININPTIPHSVAYMYEVKESMLPIYEHDDGDKFVATDNIDKLVEHVIDKDRCDGSIFLETYYISSGCTFLLYAGLMITF